MKYAPFVQLSPGFLPNDTTRMIQHDLRAEVDARHKSRAQKYLDIKNSATGVLDAEEAERDAARHEDQIAGPWGMKTFEDVSTTSTANEIREGEEQQGRLLSFPAGPGARDGLGIFGIDALEGGKKSGVDLDVQLFQPLQQIAHEER